MAMSGDARRVRHPSARDLIIAGEGLCIGYDSGDAVSSEYKGRFAFSGGRVVKVIYDVAEDQYVDIERQGTET